eukprot:s861_g17.t2
MESAFGSIAALAQPYEMLSLLKGVWLEQACDSGSLVAGSISLHQTALKVSALNSRCPCMAAVKDIPTTPQRPRLFVDRLRDCRRARNHQVLIGVWSYSLCCLWNPGDGRRLDQLSPAFRCHDRGGREPTAHFAGGRRFAFCSSRLLAAIRVQLDSTASRLPSMWRAALLAPAQHHRKCRRDRCGKLVVGLLGMRLHSRHCRSLRQMARRS